VTRIENNRSQNNAAMGPKSLGCQYGDGIRISRELFNYFEKSIANPTNR
jgi:hypothetical protein